MKHYHIDAQESGGDSYALFVAAETPDEAIEHWLDYYSLERGDDVTVGTLGPRDPDDPAYSELLVIRETPTPSVPGAVSWDDIPAFFATLKWH